jgi:hypothetical protein
MLRPIRRAIVVAAVLLLSLGMVVPAQAAAGRVTRISISSSASVVNGGSVVRISGQLVARNPTALLAGRQVSLYSKANLRTAAWSRVGSNRTNSRGVYAFAVRPSQNTIYQVVFRASGGMSTAGASYLQAVRAPLSSERVVSDTWRNCRRWEHAGVARQHYGPTRGQSRVRPAPHDHGLGER